MRLARRNGDLTGLATAEVRAISLSLRVCDEEMDQRGLQELFRMLCGPLPVDSTPRVQRMTADQ
jgi:hypothetical protein